MINLTTNDLFICNFEILKLQVGFGEESTSIILGSKHHNGQGTRNWDNRVASMKTCNAINLDDFPYFPLYFYLHDTGLKSIIKRVQIGGLCFRLAENDLTVALVGSSS